MKKVTRLLKRGNNNKKAKSAQEYNAFDTNLPTATKTGLPFVHKTHHKTKTTTTTTTPAKTKTNNSTMTTEKGTNVLINSKSHKLQLQAKHQLPSDVNINYASLNRRARSKQQRKRWRYYFLCRFCCCGRYNKHKGYWQPTKASSSNQKKNTKSRFTRWACRYLCCCCKSNNSYQNDTDDDDDIDGKFAAYICEMKEREASAALAVTSGAIRKLQNQVEESTPYVLNVDDGSSSIEQLIIPTHEIDNSLISHKNNNKDKELVVAKVRVWNWDDSLRSNSDRFLETLEEDNAMNHVSLANSFMRRPTLLSVAIKPTANGGRLQWFQAKILSSVFSSSPFDTFTKLY